MFAFLSGSDGGTMYDIARWLMIIIHWYAALTDKLHKYFGSNRVVIAIPNSDPPVEWWAVNLGCKNTIFGTLIDKKGCKSDKYGISNAYIDLVPIGVKFVRYELFWRPQDADSHVLVLAFDVLCSLVAWKNSTQFWIIASSRGFSPIFGHFLK